MGSQRGSLFRPEDFFRIFPELVEAQVDWREMGEGVPEWGKEGRGSARQRSLAGHIRCSNPDCRRGGFDLGAALSGLVDKGEVEGEGTVGCAGSKGASRASSDAPTCPNQLQFTCRLSYRKG